MNDPPPTRNVPKKLRDKITRLAVFYLFIPLNIFTLPEGRFLNKVMCSPFKTDEVSH